MVQNAPSLARMPSLPAPGAAVSGEVEALALVKAGVPNTYRNGCSAGGGEQAEESRANGEQGELRVRDAPPADRHRHK